MSSRRQAAEQRRRNWRLVLITIIVITIPFYCAGFVLWGTAAPRVTPTPLPGTLPPIPSVTPLIPPSPTPLDFFPSVTPLPVTIFPTSAFPTSAFPTVVVPTVPVYLSPTPPVVLPTNPPIPTAPPLPTVPAITNTPLPFDP